MVSELWMWQTISFLNRVLFIVFLGFNKKITIYRDVDTPGYGKDIVYGHNNCLKVYQQKCLKINIISEFHNNNSELIKVYTMLEKCGLNFLLNEKPT